MVSVDEVKRYLEQQGFTLISQDGYHIQIYTHPKYPITVKIEDKSKKQNL